MLLNGLLYTIHYAMNPVGGRRKRFEFLMLSYTPAPIAMYVHVASSLFTSLLPHPCTMHVYSTLYNVVLLFLRDITATQLNTTPEVHRRVLMLVFISLMLFIALIIMMAQLSAISDIFVSRPSPSPCGHRTYVDTRTYDCRYKSI